MSDALGDYWIIDIYDTREEALEAMELGQNIHEFAYIGKLKGKTD
jgi:hypothetical protein